MSKTLLKEILKIITDINQPVIISKEDGYRVYVVAQRNMHKDNTLEYLNCEVDRMHSTHKGDIVIRIK